MRITRTSEKKLVVFLYYYTLAIQGLMSLLDLPQMFLYFKDMIMLLAVFISICCGFNRLYTSRKAVILWG